MKMEPPSNWNQIPVSVENHLPSIQGLQLNDPMDTMITEDEFSNLTLDEAKDTLRQLSNENHQLKATVQQCNASMNDACNKLAALKENEHRKEKKLHEKARIAVETLKQSLAEKEDVIELLSKQIKEHAETSSPVGAREIEVSRKLLADYQQTASMCKQQVIQLQAQLRFEGLNNERLGESLKSAEEHIVNLQRKCDQLQNKISEDASFIENLRGHVKELQDSKKSETEKNMTLQLQLTQMRVDLENMSSEYTRLKNSGGQMSLKESESEVSRKEYEMRIDALTAQVIAAEDSIAHRDNQIQALRHHMKEFDGLNTTIKNQQEHIETLTCQGNIYKADFEAERKSREELNDKCLELQDKIDQLERGARLKADNRISPPVQPRADELRLRLGASPAEETYQAVRQMPFRLSGAVEETSEAEIRPVAGAIDLQIGNGAATYDINTPLPLGSNNPWLEEPGNVEQKQTDVCPVCEGIFPDADSLNLHVNECLDTFQTQ